MLKKLIQKFKLKKLNKAIDKKRQDIFDKGIEISQRQYSKKVYEKELASLEEQRQYLFSICGVSKSYTEQATTQSGASLRVVEDVKRLKQI